MKKIDQSNVVVEPFKLNIPAPFKIEPEYTVDLPAKCKALIFEAKVFNDDLPRNAQGQQEITAGWRVLIVNSKGTLKTSFGRDDRGYDLKSDMSTHDPLRVQLFLKRAATGLSKVKRTNVQEVEIEADD